jgi:cardiolipin synthase
VCDNRLAFVGGFNIAPEYEGNGVERGWRDLGLQVEGPLVEDLAASFDVMFARSDLQHRPFTRLRRSPARQLIASEAGQILLGGPGRGRNAIKRALLADLQQPRRVQIVSAYFLPTGRIRRALMRAARRGGLVQLILPAKTDVPLARSASHSFYQRLLRVGVEIYEYQPQILHTKLVIVDQTCYAGSANIDPRSLHINYDLMVRLTEAPLVAEARGIFDEHLRHCQRIDRRAWRASRTLWNKIKERWACFLLARLDQWLLRWQLRRLRL